MAQYQVKTAELRNMVEQLTAAAEASRAVVAHPGVVRGRAQDGGADVLRDAGARFADRWHHGLRLMSAETQRIADQLTMVADTYDQAEAQRVAMLAWCRKWLL